MPAGPPDPGGVPGPGILGAELQRRVEVVRPGTQDDSDGSASTEGLQKGPDGFTGPRDRRERPVVLARGRQRAGPCVLPPRRDEEVPGDRILGKSLCALGDFAVYPVASYMRNYPAEFMAHIEQRRCPFGGESSIEGILAPIDQHTHFPTVVVPA